MKRKRYCGYKLDDGSPCRNENIVCHTIINDREIPTCERHQYEIFDLKEREKFNNALFQEKKKKLARKRMLRLRNKNINLLKKNEHKKLDKIFRLEKELKKEKRLLDKIQTKISSLEKT